MGKRHLESSQQYENETPIKRQRIMQTSPELEGSPRPEFTLTKELAEHTILTDLMQGQWRIGKPIGKLHRIAYDCLTADWLMHEWES